MNRDERPADGPNIVYILTDQHRADALGCAGHPVVRTPHLDRLAADGVRFSRMWCQSPLCQPSRASIVTGRYVHEHGITRNTGEEFDPEWDTMMKSLQRAGYVTANIGKAHYYHRPFFNVFGSDTVLDTRDLAELVAAFGFDHVLEEFDRYAHAIPPVRTAYTEHLRAQGLLEPYKEQILSIWRRTPNHWDGVTSVLDQPNDLTCFLADAAIEWLEGYRGTRPFFLQLSFVQPHVPLMADPEWSEHYAHVDVPLGPRAAATATNATWEDHLATLREHSNSHLLTDDYVRRGARQYYGMVSLIDQRIGDILAVLTRRGWLERTWIVYAADHGELLGDHNLMGKSSFYRASVEVPCIIRPPDAARAGLVVEHPVELIDLTATLLDVAGAARPAGSHGCSLLPALRGEPNGREAVFSAIEGRQLGAERSYYVAATNGRHRCTIERSSSVACELFDLEADPDELVNLADEPAARPVVQEFRELIHEHLATG
jgi:arylsulfatase A-like enzyme